MQHTADRSLDKNGLVEQQSQIERLGQALAHLGDLGAHIIHHLQCGCTAELHHRQQHAPFAILLDDVDLRLEPVAHMSDLAQVGNGAVHAAHRQFVHCIDGVWRAVHAHCMLQLAELGGTGGQDQVLR